MLGRVTGKKVQRIEEKGTLLIESGQALEPQWFWESCWVVPAGRIGQAHTESLSTGRLAVQEGQFGIPKLMCRTPEPLA